MTWKLNQQPGSAAVRPLFRPLYADHFTESCKRISYAKICVEIDTSSALPDSFDLTLPTGAVFNIRVWYPWRLLRCESCNVFGRKTCPSKAVPMNSKPQVWVVKPTHVAPIVAEVVSPIVNDVVSVAASASPVSVSVVADGAVERIPTVVDIKKAGIDWAAYLKVLDSLVSSSGTKVVNSFSVLQNLDSGEDKPDSGAEPNTLPTDEEFAVGLNQELILQVSPPKKRGRVTARVFRNLCKQWLKVLLVLLAVKQEILGYYAGLLGTAFDGKVDAMPTLNLAIQSKVPVHFRDQLIAPVTEHEIPLSKLFAFIESLKKRAELRSVEKVVMVELFFRWSSDSWFNSDTEGFFNSEWFGLRVGTRRPTNSL
ncbi:hypothetical protein RHGRI_024074 [Rhododendron griersonianum]|uniref:Uncharacterized protein n=1 Tax=Rhododendron griersonianum TaxID=479676 RepID=A0AAV6J9B3_9ERIC|nr:hypothetical protein RHGRI_024074 [Rhododendron griersonianum]